MLVFLEQGSGLEGGERLAAVGGKSVFNMLLAHHGTFGLGDGVIVDWGTAHIFPELGQFFRE